MKLEVNTVYPTKNRYTHSIITGVETLTCTSGKLVVLVNNIEFSRPAVTGTLLPSWLVQMPSQDMF